MTSRPPTKTRMPAANLILLRHGESAWNREQRFTGWADVGLTAEGEAQVLQAARARGRAGLRRRLYLGAAALHALRSSCCSTRWAAPALPQHFDWRLNERH